MFLKLMYKLQIIIRHWKLVKSFVNQDYFIFISEITFFFFQCVSSFIKSYFQTKIITLLDKNFIN